MSNSYYNGGAYPATGTQATSAAMRAELSSITAGFDKLPTLAGNGGKFVVVNAGGTALEAVASLSTFAVVDSGFTIVDDADGTKVAKFEVSGITTGTTRTFTFPDANVTLVGEASTQTLTNKTISADDNTLSGLAASSFVLSNGSGNIDGAAAQKAIPSGVVVGTTDTQTLTNKTLTSPKVGTSILDTNGNELFLLTATASAVNELTYANAAAAGAPSFTASGSDTNISINLVPKGTGVVQSNGTAILTAGSTTIYVPATAMSPRITNGPSSGNVETSTNKVLIKTFDFDPSTAEYVQFSIRMPKSWNEGTFTAQFLWSNASGTGNVVWVIQALARSDDDTIDSAFGATQSVTDGVTAAGDLMQSAATSAITAGGTPAENDMVIFQVYRDATNGSDTLAVDARLHGVVLIYTTNAPADA